MLYSCTHIATVDVYWGLLREAHVYCVKSVSCFCLIKTEFHIFVKYYKTLNFVFLLAELLVIQQYYLLNNEYS